MTQSRYHWKETAKSQWTRPYDAVETVIHFMTVVNPDLLQWVISVGATLPEKDLSLQQIRNAWLSLRHEYPAIACTILNDGYLYEVPTEDALHEWLNDTILEDSSGRTAEEIGLSSTALAAHHAAHLFYLPDTRQIFMLLRHEVVDGVGSVILLNCLLEKIRQNIKEAPTFGEEWKRLHRPIAEIMGQEEATANNEAEAYELAEKYMQSRALSMKVKLQDPKERPMYKRFEYSFDEKETERILRACKEKGVTATNASIAATAQALLEWSGEISGPFCTVCNVNMRDLFPEPHSQAKHPHGNYISTLFPAIAVSRSTSFLDLAETAREAVHGWKYKKDNVACGHLMPKIIVDSFTQAIVQGVEVPALMVPISLGLIERYVKEPMDDFWFNNGMTGNASCKYSYTAKGRLRFVYVWCSSFFDDTTMQEFNEVCVRYMREGLGV